MKLVQVVLPLIESLTSCTGHRSTSVEEFFDQLSHKVSQLIGLLVRI